jgi:uncharacterized lipoprotein YajG
MRTSLSVATIAGLALLAACSTQSSTQQINAEQADELNAIAANQSEEAGNDIAQNAAQTGNVGQVYRAGASARPRKY